MALDRYKPVRPVLSLTFSTVPFAPTSPFSGSCSKSPKTIAPASTLKLVGKTDKNSYPSLETSQFAIPKDAHWVDLTPAGSIVVIDQPGEQSCAAIGGIMANRMKMTGVLGCVVSGRVRDLKELGDSGLPVFALGRSTVGTGAEARVLARECPVKVQGVDVNPVSTSTYLFTPHTPRPTSFHLPTDRQAPSSPLTHRATSSSATHSKAWS
jgi:hypothetical protein